MESLCKIEENQLSKRKVFLMFFMVSFAFLSSEMWSQTNSPSATATVNLVLTEVLSIAPESAASNGNINFYYESVEDYQTDQTVHVPNSLIVTFTKPFELRVQANGAFFENNDQQIPVNVLTIQRSESSALNGDAQAVALSDQTQTLMNATGAGVMMNLDLEYVIPASASSSSDMLGKSSGTYTQKVTYTLVEL